MGPLPPSFSRLWIGQTISMLGSQISSVAIPLTAVFVLRATPNEMGWLVAAGRLPMACFGLVAGVWMDGMRRKPVLVATDLAQGVALLSVPLAAWWGALTFVQLFFVAFVTGSLAVIAAVADRAYLPTLLSREQLVAGNSRIWLSRSVAQTTGPGLSGWLVQLITAPFAILLDAISFFVAAAFIASIKHREPAPKPTRTQSAWQGVREGWQRVWRDRLLRPLMLCGATHNICSTAIVTVYFLYLANVLDLGAGWIGLILASGGIGALVGSLTSRRVAGRIGIGPTLIATQAVTGFARFLIPMALGPRPAIVLFLVASEFLLGMVRAMFNITQISLRQAITPAAYHGRVNATIGFVLWSLTPIGALIGGAMGSAWGLRTTLWIAAIGVAAATFIALFSDLRTTRTVTPSETLSETSSEKSD